MSNYENFGDINFFDTGRLVKRVDEYGLEFHIITCDYDNDEENNYSIQTGTINIADMNRDDLEDICKWAGLPSFTTMGDYADHPNLLFQLVVDIFEYQPRYADDYEQKWMSKNQVIDFIDKNYMDEIDWGFYEPNFYESNRNCVVEIDNDYGHTQKRVFDSLEDALEDFESNAEKGWSLTVIDK